MRAKNNHLSNSSRHAYEHSHTLTHIQSLSRQIAFVEREWDESGQSKHTQKTLTRHRRRKKNTLYAICVLHKVPLQSDSYGFELEWASDKLRLSAAVTINRTRKKKYYVLVGFLLLLVRVQNTHRKCDRFFRSRTPVFDLCAWKCGQPERHTRRA